jgi:cytochrome c biogenesis protein CcdA
MGYLGSEKELSQKKSIFLTLAFVAGLTASYSLLGLAGYLAVGLFRLGTYMYYLGGVVAVLGGLHFAEIIRLRLPHGSGLFRALKRVAQQKGGMIGFSSMGAGFGLIICPCCLTPVFTIFALTLAKGQIVYGLALLSTFTLFHSIPLLVVAAFAGSLSYLKRIQAYRVYIGMASGSLMVFTGLLLLWIA